MIRVVPSSGNPSPASRTREHKQDEQLEQPTTDAIFLPTAVKAILSGRTKQNKSASERNVIGTQISTYRCTAKITN